MLTDINGVYDLSDVIAITRGGTPNPAAKAGHNKPVAILHYASGTRIETLASHEAAVKEWAATLNQESEPDDAST